MRARHDDDGCVCLSARTADERVRLRTGQLIHK